MNKLLTMFEGLSGKLSIVRVCLGIIVITCMANWTWACYNSKNIVPIPDNVVSLIIGFSGAKVVQRYIEKKPTNTSST